MGSALGGLCPRCLMTLAGDSAEGEMSWAGKMFGGYELIEEIARGGMGVVYRARQVSLDREVAVKMVLAGEIAGKKAQQMFQIEAHAAANLHHPNIVPVYEIGEHEMQPYFSMRLVRGGKNIAQWAAEHRGSYAAIASAVAAVARAVAHAHERGVLHRDLKPSNILWDAEAGPQVTDFGLAKLLDSPDGMASASIMLMGSPNYMAPEQTGGRHDEITTATDVYGLGAVLYELLAGKPPFLGKSVMDIARKVADSAPPPLTEVPRDLRTVCMKCLEKQPADRYASAAALAEDLERFTRNEPVQAVPHTRAELLWRWAKRKPALATLTALIPLLSIIGFSAVTWQWQRAENARVEQAVALERLQWEQTDQWIADGDSPRALAYLASRLRTQPHRWQAAMYAMSIVDQTTFPLLAGPKVQMPSKLEVPAQLAPDGSWFATAGKDKVVRIWDVATGSETQHFAHTSTVAALAVSSGSWKLAIATADGLLAVRADLAADSQPLPRASKEPIVDLRFSADGSRLLARGKDSVEIWASGSSTTTPFVLPLPGGIKGASLSADGSRVLVWNQDRAVVWEVGSQKELLAVSKRVNIAKATLAANGKVMACLDGKFHARSWDIDSGKALPEVESELAARYHLALDATGAHMALGGFGNDLTVHDTASGLKVSPVMRHNYHVDSITVSPDGQRLFSVGWDEMLYCWDAATGRSLRAPARLSGLQRGSSVSPSQDGSCVLISSPPVQTGEETISVWISSTRPPVLKHRVEGYRNFSDGAMSHDSKLGYLSADEPGPKHLHVYEIATGKVLIHAPVLGDIYSAHFSPDMTRCYAVTNAGSVHGFSLSTGEPLWPANKQSGGIIPAALSPTGTRLIAGHSSGFIRIYDTATGKVVHEIGGLGELRTLRFAPDGSGRFVSGSRTSGLHVWDVHTGEKLQTFSGHNGTVLATAWSPDSRTLASACGDYTVRLWSVATGQSMAILAHLAVPTHLEFSPDGSRLATCTRDGTVRLWDARTGHAASPWLRQGEACTTVRFTADGAAFFVHDHGGFRFWDTATALPVTQHYADPVAGGFAFDSEANHRFMSLDGCRVFLGNARNDGVAYTIPQPRGPVPEWFPSFLETLAQLRLNDQGSLEPAPHVDIAIVLAQLRAAKEDDFTRWALRILAVEGR